MRGKAVSVNFAAPVASVVLSSEGFLTITYHYECFMSDKQTSHLGEKKKAEMSAVRTPLEGKSKMNPAFKIKGLRGLV